MNFTLTKRDEELLLGLQRYGVLSTKMVASMYFSGVQIATVLRRLRKLESADFLNRTKNSEGENVWFLTVKVGKRFPGFIAKTKISKHVVDHDLMLSRIRIILEHSGIVRAWIPEHEIRSRVATAHGFKNISNRLIPDGIMGVFSDDCHQAVAVELELNLKQNDRYSPLFYAYALKKEFCSVWYIVPDATKGQHLEKIWNRCVRADTKVSFQWSVLSEVFAHSENAAIYQSGNQRTIRDLWLPQVGALGAQAVGSTTDENGRSEKLLTNENEKKSSAPHNFSEVNP